MRSTKQASGQIDFYVYSSSNSPAASNGEASEGAVSSARVDDEEMLLKSVQLSAEPQSLLDIAVENSVDISHSCGGMGSCGTCRVFLSWEPKEAAPNSPTEIEEEMRQDRGFIAGERLACQTVWGEAFGSLQTSPRWRVRVPTK